LIATNLSRCGQLRLTNRTLTGARRTHKADRDEIGWKDDWLGPVAGIQSSNQLVLMSSQTGSSQQRVIRVLHERDVLAAASEHRDRVLADRQRRREDKAREFGMRVDEFDDDLWRALGFE